MSSLISSLGVPRLLLSAELKILTYIEKYRLHSVARLGQLVVPLNRKSRPSAMASWVCHLLDDRATGRIGRWATTWMSVLSPNRPSPMVHPRSTPYPPNWKRNSEEPEVRVTEVVVFLPRNSPQLLLSVLRTRCLLP